MRFRHSNRKTVISIRLACSFVVLAILAAVTPHERSDAAANQVIEMPGGLGDLMAA
jgi:hypothetical protein